MFTQDQQNHEYNKLMYNLKKFSRDIKLELLPMELISYRLRKFLKFVKPFTKSLPEVEVKSNYFTDKKIAVYTVIFGNYDRIIEPLTTPDNIDYYIITNIDVPSNSIWKKLEVDLDQFGLSHASNIEKNRFFKMMPHKVFKNYEYSVYVDGNIKVVSDLSEYVQSFNEYGVKFHMHSSRDCIYDEIKRCIKKKRDSKKSLKRYRKRIIKLGMPKNNGLLEATVIVRQHFNEKCIFLMEQWWKEFSLHLKRDQILLAYIIWNSNIESHLLCDLGESIKYNYSFHKIRHI